MGATIEEITAKLEDAAKPTQVESSTTEKETVAAKESEETEKGTTKKGSNAQERIQELVAKAKGFEERAAELENRLAEKDQEVGKLIDLVKDREQDSRIVAKINDLHANDPEYKDIVEKLDRAIRGLEPVKDNKPAAAETLKPGEDLLKGIKGELDRRTESQAAEIADQRSDLLLMKSELVLEKLFAQLPSAEYTEDDQRVLNSALADFVDWDAIEANPKLLEKEVAGGFQKAVDWYGNPRGRIATEAAKQTNEGTDAKSESTVDFSKLDFGKLKTVNEGGKERQAPAISDDEFAAMMGAALRRERGGR